MCDFLASADLARNECYLPAAIDNAVRAGTIEVRVVSAPNTWCGMTWPEDRDRVTRRLAEQSALRRAAEGFGLDVQDAAPVPFGDGLINTTWRLDTIQGPYLIQRINSDVFPDPVAVAENAAAAAIRLDNALRSDGDNDPRHRLIFRAASGNRPWTRDSIGNVWRAAVFIPDARPANPTRPDEVRSAARALGRFPGLVTEGAGPGLAEVLPGFHNTRARLEMLIAGANNDTVRRLESCRAEFDRLIGLAPLASRLTRVEMPIRFVHNDAKLDNVLVDINTGEVLCVIDLDTTMPGLAVHDFGDLVRSAVTGRPEDETDLDRIVVRESTFHDLATGYLEGAAGWIDLSERSKLVDGAFVITYEQTLRFLEDYLAGDCYFPVDDDGHNLRRARAQLRLLEQLLVSEEDLRRIIDNV